MGEGGVLNYISSSHGAIGLWTMSSTDLFVPAHLDEGASDQLVVIAANLESLCVLTFADGSFTRVQSQPSDFIAPLRTGDFDGDGLDELVALVSGGQRFPRRYVARSESADLLMGFSPAEALASVSGFVNSTWTVLWKQQGSIPGSVGLKSTDQFYAADADRDGNDELVLFGPTDGWLFTIKWAGSQLQDFTSVQGSGDFGILKWPSSAVCFGPPQGTDGYSNSGEARSGGARWTGEAKWSCSNRSVENTSSA